MPKLNKSFHLEITIEQFLEACSPLELQELDLLIQSPRYQNKIKVSQIPEVSKNNQDAPDWIKKLGVGNFN